MTGAVSCATDRTELSRRDTWRGIARVSKIGVASAHTGGQARMGSLAVGREMQLTLNEIMMYQCCAS